MNAFTGTVFMPHPPVIVPEVGKGREKEAHVTIAGMEKASKWAASKKPDIIIVLSPHGNMMRDCVTILGDDILEGSFASFGCRNISIKKRTSEKMLNNIESKFLELDIPNLVFKKDMSAVFRSKPSLDHGCLVPLYFIDKYWDKYEIVHITPGFFGSNEYKKIGQAISAAIDIMDKKVMILASGDLSHRLKDERPYDYHPDGTKFDNAVFKALESCDLNILTDLSSNVLYNAGQCGYGSFIAGMSAMSDKKCKSVIYSYEGPFGVGYLTASMEAVN